MNDILSVLFSCIADVELYSSFNTKNYYSLEFLQYSETQVKIINNYLKNIGLRPKFKNKNTLEFNKNEFLTLRKAVYNLTFYPIISDPNNWEDGPFYKKFKYNGYPPIPAKVIQDYFSLNGIGSYLHHNTFTISKTDYVKLKRVNLSCQLSPALTGKRSVYNPIREDEWKYYKGLSDIYVHFYAPETCPVSEDDFWKDMKKATLNHPYNNLILRNNIDLSNKMGKLLLNLYLFPKEEFDKEHPNYSGLYYPQVSRIEIPLEKEYDPINFFITFFHELNHQNQDNSIETKPDSLLKRLIFEADSKAVSILNNPIEQRPFYHKIQNNILRNIQPDTYTDDLKSKVPLEQKIVDINWAIQSDVEEAYHQFIFDLFLAKDRAAIFDVLNKNNIALSPEEFNRTCAITENWRSFYYTVNKGIAELGDSIDTKSFKTYFKLDVNPAPEAMLSVENLREFGCAVPSEPDKPYLVRYNGLTSAFLKEFDESIQKNDYQKTCALFKWIQKQNPILKTVLLSGAYSQSQVKGMHQMIHAMAEGKKLSTVLSALNYDITPAPPAFIYPKTPQR